MGADLDAIPDMELTTEHFRDIPVEHVLCLVPWADTLNHSVDADERSILQFDYGTKEAVLFAHRDYAPGDEVFDSYGTAETASSLLLNFGFVGADMVSPVITVRSPAQCASRALLCCMLHCALPCPDNPSAREFSMPTRAPLPRLR